MKKATTASVAQEVRTLNNRVNGLYGITRLTVQVQIEQLAKAERLRQIAVSLVEAGAPAGGGRREMLFKRLAAFVLDLQPFHKPPRMKIPPEFDPAVKRRKRGRR